MPRSTWILASAVTLALAAFTSTPALAGKPQPPPSAPKIVALVGTNAIASDGTVYGFHVPSGGCTASLVSIELIGQFFTTPPVSPITSVMDSGGGLLATLANGDLWLMNMECCTPCSRKGTYLGNIFTVAGTALGSVAPPLRLAPVWSAQEATEDGAPAARGPRRPVSPAPGVVE